MSYASIDFNLWADIDGTVVELVQFACNYEMNNIPSCTAVLPVGYTAVFPHLPSTAHGATAGLQLQVPLTVWVTSTLASSDSAGIWPAGTYKLFCGWVTGVGYRRTHTGYAMTIEGTHWLSALSFASTLSSTSHPHNPADFIFNSQIEMDGSGGSLTHQTVRTAAQSVCTGPNIQKDLWGDALKPWFDELACKDRINILYFPAGDKNDSTKFQAKAALDLINAGPGAPTLPFNVGGADANHAALAIADDIAVSTLTPSNAGNTMNAMAHTTFWDKIVGELSGKYHFKLIPFPDRASIVPFVPGLRAEWNPGGGAATLLARDMSHQDLNCHLPRPIRGVGYFAGQGAKSGGNLSHNDSVTNGDMGGMYIGRDDGMVIIKRAPKYLSEYMLPVVYSRNAAGLADVRGNAFNHPGVGTKDANPKDPDAVKGDQKILLVELAHATYVNELLRQRYGDIVGAVRFDISPGSTISFQGTEGSLLPTGGEKRYGAVMRVSHFFDAQHQRCQTGFRLTHVRTEAEHYSDNYTVTAHPLYSQAFDGDYNLYLGGASCPSMIGSC